MRQMCDYIVTSCPQCNNIIKTERIDTCRDAIHAVTDVRNANVIPQREVCGPCSLPTPESQ